MSVYIDGDKQITENYINDYSYYQYSINDDGSLYKNNTINKSGSLYYSEAIDRIINDQNTKVIIKYSENGIEYLDGMTIYIKEFGGGATFFKKNETDPSELYVYYMKYGLSDEGEWDIDAAQVLMHEIVGHADPIADGGDRDKENATENENKVLEQLNLNNKKRKVNPCHTAR